MGAAHKSPYNWTLENAVCAKDKGTVFSGLACGGGSAMGYKRAGFDVVGCNEIDPRMMAVYVANHKPQYSYLEPIQEFKQRKDLPAELYDLDILDGSPPCTTFSEAGLREKVWGVEKKFREGQTKQVLDTLFYDYIDLVEILKPKVAISENVEGLLLPSSMHYVREIYRRFSEIGYICQHFVVDGSLMGVPQARRRVFFIAIRKELTQNLRMHGNIFEQLPYLDLSFNEKPITYGEIAYPLDDTPITGEILKVLNNAKPTETDLRYACKRLKGKASLFSYKIVHDNSILGTITASGAKQIIYKDKRYINTVESIRSSTFPADFDFCGQNPVYVMGMSVPPVMMAQVASRIHEQWLSRL